MRNHFTLQCGLLSQLYINPKKGQDYNFYLLSGGNKNPRL